MDKERWQLYMELQTGMAYPQGVSISDLEHPTNAQPHLPPGRLLVIGPGGPGEIDALGRDRATVTALSVLKPECERLRKAGISAVYGDMHAPPFKSSSFQVIYSSNVFEHCFAPYITLMECRRIIEDGGFLYFSLPPFESPQSGEGPFHLHCLSDKVWVELLHKTGWHVTTIREFKGVKHPRAVYMHFLCEAEQPPHPHDKILSSLRHRYP